MHWQTPQQADEWLEQILATGIEPSARSYNLVIKMWARGGHVREVEGWLQKMKERHVALNEYVYTNAAQAYLISGDVEGTMQVLGRMQAEDVDPNAVTYVVQNVLVKLGEIAKAREMLDELEASGAEMSAACYTTVMHYYARNNDEENARAIWQQLQAKGLQPDGQAFATLISMYAKAGNLQAAEQLYQEMLDRRMGLNAAVCSSMIMLYGKGGNTLKASEMFKRMQDAGMVPHGKHIDWVEELACEEAGVWFVEDFVE